MPTRHGHWRPDVRDLCAISDVATSSFRAKDIARAIGHSRNMITWLNTHGLIRSGSGRGNWAVTPKGQRMFARACKVRRR